MKKHCFIFISLLTMLLSIMLPAAVAHACEKPAPIGLSGFGPVWESCSDDMSPEEKDELLSLAVKLLVEKQKQASVTYLDADDAASLMQSMFFPYFGNVYAQDGKIVCDNTSFLSVNMMTDSYVNSVQLPDKSLLDKEKAEFICRSVCDYYEYDRDSAGIYAVDFVRSLSTHRAVCQHYAELYQILCNKAGIPCKLIFGYTSKGEAHMWNYVLIDGEWQYIDVAWIDGGGDYWFSPSLWKDHGEKTGVYLMRYAPLCKKENSGTERTAVSKSP